MYFDYNVHEQRGDVDAKIIAYEIGQRFIWDNKALQHRCLVDSIRYPTP